MSANLQDLLVCLAVWAVPTGLMALVGLLGDRVDQAVTRTASSMTPQPIEHSRFGLPGAAR